MLRRRRTIESYDSGAAAAQEREQARVAPGPRTPAWAAARGAAPAPGLIVQAKQAEGQPTAEALGGQAAGPAEAEAATPAAAPALLLIDDDAPGEPGPGQMRKSEFLELLRAQVCATADQALAGTIWSSAGCPYIEHWFTYYADRDSAQIERALRRYVPAAAGAAGARDYIPLICARIRGAIATWADTGEVTGVPEGTPALPAAAAPTPGPLAKSLAGVAAPAAGAAGIAGQLGAGRPLEGGTRARMESAFGADFSDVRVHTDRRAAGAASTLRARAFTVGRDVAFGAGEYQPGTPVGDALMAHELAHVMQQREAGPELSTLQPGGAEYDALEHDADRSAVGAVATLWGGASGALRTLARNALPTLRSGLRLQGCSGRTVEQKQASISKISGLIGDPQTNEKAVIAEIDDLGSDAAEVLMHVGPFAKSSGDTFINALAGSEEGQRVLARVSQALRDGDLSARLRADAIDKVLKDRQTATKPTIKPDDQKAIDRITKALDADPRKGDYAKAKIPLRLPVTIYEPGKEMMGGVYYNPYMPSDPKVGGDAGRTRSTTWTSKTHDPQYPLIYVQIGPLALTYTDEYIRSVMWHEFQHFRQYLRFREPSAGKTAETKTLEAESAAAGSSGTAPNAELEATSIQIADDFAKLNDDELRDVLRYLASFLTHSSSQAVFIDAAVDRIKKSLSGDRKKQDRMLAQIGKLSRTEQTQLKKLTDAIKADLAPLPKKPGRGK